MALKNSIKQAINKGQDKWIAKRVWSVSIDGPQMLSGTDTMMIEVSVVRRKKKKSKKK